MYHKLILKKLFIELLIITILSLDDRCVRKKYFFTHALLLSVIRLILHVIATKLFVQCWISMHMND